MKTQLPASVNPYHSGKKDFSVLSDSSKDFIAGCWLLTSVLLLAVSTKAQSLENIQLRVENINDFAEGYNLSMHTYNEAFIRRVLTNPTSRPVVASVLASIPVARIKMESTNDGERCRDIQVRLAPSGASAFVWTLKGQDLLRNQEVIIKQVKKVLKPLPRPRPGLTCIPRNHISDKVITQAEGEMKFSAPIPHSQAAHNIAATYTVQFDILDGNNRVILSQNRKVSVPRYVPLIVSVGDSYASGEGNPDRVGNAQDDHYDWKDWVSVGSQRDCEDDATVMIQQGTKPVMIRNPYWLDPRDHRSLRSGPALAARKLLKEWPYVVFLSFAKSGAVISSSKQENDILEQLEHVRRVVGDHKIDALLLSAGGNDVGFSNVLTGMAKDFRGSDGQKVLSKFLDRTLVLRNQSYPKIDAKIQELNLNIGKVLINEYSGHLFNDRNGNPQRGCGVFESFRFWAVSKGDAIAMERMGNMLNGEVKLAANKYGWHYVGGISDQFKNHGYCSGQSFYRGGSDSCDQQGDFNGTMHPNEQGTAVIAKALARELRRVLARPVVASQ
jgi:lysophospholipase L1-like esterase